MYIYRLNNARAGMCTYVTMFTFMICLWMYERQILNKHARYHIDAPYSCTFAWIYAAVFTYRICIVSVRNYLYNQ